MSSIEKITFTVKTKDGMEYHEIFEDTQLKQAMPTLQDILETEHDCHISSEDGCLCGEVE